MLSKPQLGRGGGTVQGIQTIKLWGRIFFFPLKIGIYFQQNIGLTFNLYRKSSLLFLPNYPCSKNLPILNMNVLAAETTSDFKIIGAALVKE